MNQVTVVGNLTDVPEMRFTPSGSPLAKFTLADNRRWRGQDGEWQEETSFFDVTVWGDQAERVSESLSKGDRVLVSGRLEQQKWVNDAGENRSKVAIVANEVAASLRWATVAVTRVSRQEGAA